MPIDTYRSSADSLITGARAPFAIAPHDTNEVAVTPKAIYVGTGGHVALRGIDATADVVFRNVPSGAVIDVRPQFIRATGTTAADLVGLA
jgi:hypothetical protein